MARHSRKTEGPGFRPLKDPMYKFIQTFEIQPDSTWHSCNGAGIQVTVTKVEDGQVYYRDVNGQEYDKDAFSFQVRYYHPVLSLA